MKKGKFLLLFLLLAGIFISCSSDDDEIIIEDEAKMLTFGFYADDNPDVIFQDYVVENITGEEINFLLPEEVEKSSLVARFTTTEGDMVKVNGVEQESGITDNDFTVPVDYIVSEGTANVKYTVTVNDAPAFVWNALPPFASDEAKDLRMKVNPVNGNPYFLYKQERESSDDENAEVVVFTGDAWSSQGEVSDGRVGNYFDITFDSEGTPYVSYSDYTTDPTRKLTVKEQSGSSWTVLGENGFTSDRYSYHSISFVNPEKLMLAGTFDGRSGPLARRELGVNFFEGNVWDLDNTIPGRPADLRGYLVVTAKKDDAVYVGSFDAVSPNSVSVHKYSNGSWETIIDKWADPNASGISLRDFDIAVDNDHNVYVALADDSSAEEEKHRVIKYNATSKEIESVGNYITAAQGSYVNFDLAVSPFGIPFLFYRNENKFPTVVSLDKDTQDWTSPKILDSAEADELSIDFAADGIGFLSYVKDNVIVAYKYSAE